MVELFICMNVFWHYSTLIKFALRGNRGFYEAREYLAEVLIEELEEFVDLKNKLPRSKLARYSLRKSLFLNRSYPRSKLLGIRPLKNKLI